MSTPFLFTVPCGLNRTDEILALNTRMKALGKHIRIQAYDQLLDSQWNGGRLIFKKDPKALPSPMSATRLGVDHLAEVRRRVQRLNEAGVGFNLAFNSTMESLDVDDEDGNLLLEMIHNEQNGVTIATESLRRHVTANYPKLERTASICFTYDKLEQYQRACTLYDWVVMMPAFAYQPEFLAQLPAEKLVFIVNDTCYIHCPRKDHYDYSSRAFLIGNTSSFQQYLNSAHPRCLLAEPKYRAKVHSEMDRKFTDRIDKIKQQQLEEDGLTPKDMESTFTLSPAARRGLIQSGVKGFKLQGREFLDDGFQRKVVDFLEKIIQQEL